MIIIYSTFPNKDEAQRIAKGLLEKRLVACANIMAGHDAMYWWDGSVQSGSEVAVLFKTRAELFEDVEKTIKSEHSYEVPCVVSWPIVRGYAPFLKWIEDETSK